MAEAAVDTVTDAVKVEDVTPDAAKPAHAHDGHDHDHHGHDHDHDHNHDHDHDESSQSRSEKKARKALLKMGLVKVANIERITVRTKQKDTFHVAHPDVYRLPGDARSGTFVIFGEAKSADQRQQWQESARELMQQQAAAQAAAASGAAAPAVSAPAPASVAAPADDVVVDEKNVDLVMAQAPNKTREEVVALLKKHKNDVVEAVMSLNS